MFLLHEPFQDPYQEDTYSCGGSSLDLIIYLECGDCSYHSYLISFVCSLSLLNYIIFLDFFSSFSYQFIKKFSLSTRSRNVNPLRSTSPYLFESHSMTDISLLHIMISTDFATASTSTITSKWDALRGSPSATSSKYVWK